MNEKNTERLQSKYPSLFGNLRYGFECGNGWFDVLNKLGSKVEPLVEGMPEFKERMLIVKEKFGMLNVQGYFFPEEMPTVDQVKMKTAIKEAEQASLTTCQKCGTTISSDDLKNATSRQHRMRWCNQCFKEHDTRE